MILILYRHTNIKLEIEAILKDYKIALTGIFCYGDRDRINQLIKHNGGEVLSQPTICNVDVLIVGSKTEVETRIMHEAIEFGTNIVDETWLFSTISEQKIADIMQHAWFKPFHQSKFIQYFKNFLKNYFDQKDNSKIQNHQ